MTKDSTHIPRFRTIRVTKVLCAGALCVLVAWNPSSTRAQDSNSTATKHVSSTAIEATTTSTMELSVLLKNASRKTTWKPVSADEFRQLQRLFERTITSPDDVVKLRSAWLNVGWQLNELTDEHGTLLVIHAADETKRGHGFYAIRPDVEQHIVLQAPHCFADLHTRDISTKFFQRGTFSAAAWNTTHRRNVDVAHTRLHPFNAFMQAIAATFPDVLFVQLHGFAKSKRDTAAGVSSDMIVSDGTRDPQRWVRQAALLLQHEMQDYTSRLYPTEVRELGATTNVQAQLLMSQTKRRFLHLEMSGKLRKRMREDRTLQTDFLKHLIEIYRFSQR